jgi:glycosyltransferase involved in cell wall biosynthesis
MRVLHINATSHRGGAARAMRRLHHALLEKGHLSQFLVSRSISPEDPLVHLIWEEVAKFTTPVNSLKSRIGNLLEKYIGLHPWSNQNNLRIPDTELFQWTDIIDLRNLFGSYFNLWGLPEISAAKPVVWRMPDLWAVTGHCAYPYDCMRWKTGCYSCPLLTPAGRQIVEPNPTILDGTRRVWYAKRDIYNRSRLHVIVTTEWMRKQVSQSILQNALTIDVISNGVNLDVFRPHDRLAARRKLSLDPEEKILLWAAGGKGNYRKGYHLAYRALEILQTVSPPAPLLITMGGEQGWDHPETLSRIQHYGFVEEAEKQALIYAAADGFLCTTLADGQPQTALESIACGTPVIAFDIGPMPGLALEGQTGMIVSPTSSEALALQIRNHLMVENNLKPLRENCRKYAQQNFDLEVQTDRYVSLYEQILHEC